MNLGNLKNSKLVLVGDNYTIVIPGRQTMEPNSSSYSKFQNGYGLFPQTEPNFLLKFKSKSAIHGLLYQNDA